jgi:hypothetical protein
MHVSAVFYILCPIGSVNRYRLTNVKIRISPAIGAVVAFPFAGKFYHKWKIAATNAATGTISANMAVICTPNRYIHFKYFSIIIPKLPNSIKAT